jgi:GNAT superfamily N-acetyltransferase
MTRAPGAPEGWATEVRLLRPAGWETGPVLAMLARCSRASLFHRFHGFSDGVAYFRALLRDRSSDQTLLACYRATCVGVATLGVGAAGIVDLGILVEDAWQRRGIGTRLASSLLDGARAQGVTTVHAEVLSDDQFILRFLRQSGPLTVSIERGSLSVDIDLRRQPSKYVVARGAAIA